MSAARYLLKLALFLSPLAIMLALPLAVLWKAGEFIDQDTVVKAMSGTENVLVGNAYWPQSSEDLVLAGIDSKRPKIIALGNSRVLQFRKEFFSQSFFNAGGTIQNIGESNWFLKHLPAGYKPEVIILGLEQSYFHPKWTNRAMYTAPQPVTNVSSLMVFMTTWPKIYADYFRGKFRIADFFSPKSSVKTFGLNALINGNGLRNDGSYFYGKITRNPNDQTAEDYAFKDTKHRIETACCKFDQSSDVSQDALTGLEAFLDTCAREKIFIVAFLPPYPHPVYQKLLSLNDKYSYISKLEPALAPLFKKYGYPLFDFTDLNSTGAGEKEYIDGLHASEKAYLRIWIKMAEGDKVLNAYANLTTLNKRLLDAKSDYEVFSMNE